MLKDLFGDDNVPCARQWLRTDVIFRKSCRFVFCPFSLRPATFLSADFQASEVAHAEGIHKCVAFPIHNDSTPVDAAGRRSPELPHFGDNKIRQYGFREVPSRFWHAHPRKYIAGRFPNRGSEAIEGRGASHPLGMASCSTRAGVAAKGADEPAAREDSQDVSGAATYDAIVLGGGAAGLMYAVQAGLRGRRVIVLERAERIGKKILISGGGRCNFTNLHTRPENFISANPHFAKSALARYTPTDFIAWVERHGIAYHEKTLGQLFCDGSAAQIVDALEQDAVMNGATIVCSARVRSVTRTTEFVLDTADGQFRAPALIVATGGLSIPKMGATSYGYDLARQFGHGIVECRPALVPFVLSAEDAASFCDLSGVSTEVVASIDGQKDRQSFREKMLITHRGLSGPAILQISSYWREGTAVSLDLLPDARFFSEVMGQARRDRSVLSAALRTRLPARLAERLLDLYQPDGFTNRHLDEFEARLHQWQIVPLETEGYAKAEVTAGGVDTNKLSARTLESRLVPGLFFIGEVVDVTGHLGGYNFQWAWASAYASAQAL